MKLLATHAFNCIVLLVKFGRTSCKNIPLALWCGCLYICACVCICTYTHVCTCVCACVCVCTSTSVCMCIFVCMLCMHCVYLCACCVYASMYTCVHENACVYVFAGPMEAVQLLRFWPDQVFSR